MTASRFLLVTILALSGFGLSACETVKQDIRSSVASTQEIFNDFSMEKLLAATPQKPQTPDALIDNKALATATRTTIPVEEHIVTADRKIIPVPRHRPTELGQPVATASATDVARSGPGCPDVRIVGDLNQLHQFSDNQPATESNSVSAVWLQDIQESCRTSGRDVTVDMTLAFTGQLGSKGKAHSTDKPSFAYPYFVAITNNQGNIVAKEVFAVTMTYDGGKTTENKVEKIRQIIPVASGDISNYKVLVGFQLTDQELAYNRAHPAAIMPAAGE